MLTLRFTLLAVEAWSLLSIVATFCFWCDALIRARGSELVPKLLPQWMGSEPFRVGEIVVFKVKGRDIPIVHRVLEVHDKCASGLGIELSARWAGLTARRIF